MSKNIISILNHTKKINETSFDLMHPEQRKGCQCALSNSKWDLVESFELCEDPNASVKCVICVFNISTKTNLSNLTQ